MVLHERAARSSEVYKTTVIADILMEQIGYRRFTADFISLKLKRDSQLPMATLDFPALKI